MGRGDKRTTSVEVTAGTLTSSSSSEGLRPDHNDEDPALLAKLEVETANQPSLPAAFELIAEACAAVKIAEDRVHTAEEALEDAESYYSEQIEALTQRLNVADKRAEAAERQAARAEERLRIFCQTILTTMHKVS